MAETENPAAGPSGQTSVDSSAGASIVVVGVDGSDSSKHALRWAARQARLTGSVLHAVAAWNLPAGYGFAPNYSYTDMAAEAGNGLDETIAEVFGDMPDVPLVSRVERGHAAAVLVEASRGADLLVVGSRGRGAFAGMMLGSVSRHCAENADCPVLIVRHPRDRDRES